MKAPPGTLLSLIDGKRPNRFCILSIAILISLYCSPYAKPLPNSDEFLESAKQLLRGNFLSQMDTVSIRRFPVDMYAEMKKNGTS